MLKKVISIYLVFFIYCLKYEEYDPKKFAFEKINDETGVCLASDAKVDEFLEFHNITYTKDKNDPNLKFIIGDCNPVVFVPGIYSTKLQVKINCRDLMSFENSLFEKIRVFCGKHVCSDSKENDPDVTYDFWLSAIRKGFDLWRWIPEDLKHKMNNGTFDENLEYTTDWDNRYGACLGFFLSIFNNPDECPVIKDSNDTEENITRICGHSQNIQISYGGGFINKDIDSGCGVNPIENVLYCPKESSQADVFMQMSNYLINQGYKKGFSLSGVPNDFRKFINTNKFANEALKYHIERMFNLTGKPVIIIAHSFGNLVTLDTLTKLSNDEKFKNKIKKWISLAPPFAGATKAIEYFLHGMDDFDKDLPFSAIFGYLRFERFGQKIMLKSIPTIYELKPFSIFSELFNNTEYLDFADAIRERISLEKKCRDYACSMEDIEKNSVQFNKYFGKYFPSLTSDFCKYEDNIGGNKTALNKKCMIEAFNVVDCPSMVKIRREKNNFGATIYNIDDYCDKDGEDLYYSIDCDKKENKSCLNELLTEVPYFYDVYHKERDYLIERFNDNFGNKFHKKIDENYFESEELIKRIINEMVKYQQKISTIKNLPISPVDIDIVFSTFNPTLSAEFLDEDLNVLPKDQGGVVNKGGDGTVPSWSPIFTGLKWIYEKETKNLNQTIRLVQYCSRLGKSGIKLDNFKALPCRCIDTEKNVYKDNLEDCAHQGMLNDENLFDYIKDEIYEYNEEKKQLYENDTVKAVNDYNSRTTDYNYVGECNHKLALLISPNEKQPCSNIKITAEQYNNKYCSNQGYDVLGKDYECCSVHINGITDLSENFDTYECIHLKADKKYLEYFREIYKTEIKYNNKYSITKIDFNCKSISLDKSCYLHASLLLYLIILFLLF